MIQQVRRANVDRARFDYIIGHYLRECYRAQSVARSSELAQRLNANRATFSRRFSEVLGHSLVIELRHRRLAEATRLLRTTDLTIAEVAARSAFGDRSTFFRIFRSAYGMTPAEYRKGEKAKQQNATLRR